MTGMNQRLYSLYRLRNHCTLAHGRYGLVLATCTAQSADGWNALKAVQGGGPLEANSFLYILSNMQHFIKEATNSKINLLFFIFSKFEKIKLFCNFSYLALEASYKDVGPSGVRALPLAAGINKGGHYF